MKLHFRSFGQGEPLIILHGVFGSSDNWQTVGKSLSGQFKIYLVDQRNHGSSPHSEEFNYSVMADDLLSLMMDEGIESAHLLGHSMGGKTAMTFTTRYPERVKKLIVVDMATRYYPPHHENIFRAFRSLNLPEIQSRKQADDELAHELPDFGVRQFILKNLTRKDNDFVWKLNLDAIEANAEKIGAALDDDAWFNGHVLFIGGSESDYIQKSDFEAIHQHFPNAKIEFISGAGHWVHAEQPRPLIQKVTDFLLNG